MDLTVAVALITGGSTLAAGFGAVGLTTWFQHREQKAAAKRRLVAVVDAAVTSAAAGIGSAAALVKVDTSFSQRVATLMGVTRPIDAQRAMEAVMSQVWILVEAVAEARQLGDNDLFEAIRDVHDRYLDFQGFWTDQIGREPRSAVERDATTEASMQALFAALDRLRAVTL
ncbi:hypothetical protein [Rudaeicoccus suwonensis]|uniref:Uncharacterized protein n=1 Tax=Rudaeicoccus suwonensis TaxID=657409 RepID=A0A561EAH0_9MICO|nr:hypothetical protein [Rudaeicoccus suwonensis]TWE12599.1 hypothetical protein BKA23_1414 [Rudaeicoccus suwonensis]